MVFVGLGLLVGSRAWTRSILPRPCMECAVTVISAALPGLTEGRAWH
jgi:hypothetical protein